MKKLNNNAFTLTELLAVIVILALLVTLVVPSVTKYLNNSKKDTFYTHIKIAVNAVKDDISHDDIDYTTEYTLNDINNLLDTDLVNSPFGSSYAADSRITVVFEDNGFGNSDISYFICLRDGENNGYKDYLSSLTSRNDIKIGEVESCD